MDKLSNVTDKMISGGVELFGNIIDKIILYGSYARGDFDEESDVDIMFILNCGASELSRYRDSICELSSDIGLDNDIMVSILLKDSETFYKWIDVLPFYQNVQREGVVLYG